MESRLFRKQSVDRVSSPEQLQDYMKVTNPGIWMVLAAVIVLLAGLIASSALATLESSVPAQGEALAGTGEIYLELPLAQKDVVQPGMEVRVANQSAHVDYLFQDNETLGVVVTWRR